ncbi:ABC transporter ATP-binding protein [Brevibacterium aurantiacum]|uniref:Duplicated ATPase component YkoD of energizing module of thiamin-regulated ECF transporter for HydroxyMethylPyrimidine n=1 Tax=Brevibacterium aurantiacum TaxID=273384 RepID=A0A1D7W103_BREAU|nr:ABC transporter ATP-binding protein [Brevibacterium aurantiacum]AOP52739.1 Duplicated ATPase component YkoD of energizing module of thiamin-regulated ECF transporter for HydroxyMethylPyrimidine [Brevibacterium aurantiacum]RCS98482.1 ABC transporter ATP-binding protein [Brevibacterium aurantiacum]
MALPIRARGFSWRHADRDEPAVGPLDLDIAAGEKVLLLGPSGAGKTTLLHAIAGVLPAESGEADGQLLIGDRPPDPRRGETGLVLQDPDSQVIFSRVGDDVAFGMENLGLPADVIAARIPTSLAAMGLGLPHDHPTAALSGGQKQRLALAGIHAMAPQVIILDEPTANIDPDSAASVRDAVLETQAATSATMVIVEHRVGLWLDHVDTVIVLGPAGLLAQGLPRSVFGDPALAEVLVECGIWVPETAGPSNPAVQPGAEPLPHPDGEVVLTTECLSVARPGAKLPAATGLDLSVRSGEALGIVGANGAGKSTLALTLGGLIREVEGEVRAVGNLRDGAKHARPFRWPSAFLAPRIGMVFQEPEHQFLRSSVTEELALGPRLAGWSNAEVDDRVAELLEVLGLEKLAEAHPQGLSGGEKRRLSVAAMMAPRPQVLIVDEPTFGQDALTWAGLVEQFIDVLARGSAVVAVSHDHAFLDAIGARRVELSRRTKAGERIA